MMAVAVFPVFAVDVQAAQGWREAYAALLNNYLPRADEMNYFVLHDMDLDGVPELFVLINYGDGENFYTFRNGRVLLLESDGITIMSHIASARQHISPAPNNMPGFMTFPYGQGTAFGASVWISRIVIENDRLVADDSGAADLDHHAVHSWLVDNFGQDASNGAGVADDIVNQAIDAHTHFTINDNTVSKEEFNYYFSRE